MNDVAIRRWNAPKIMKMLLTLTVLFFAILVAGAWYARSYPVEPIPLKPCKRCTGGCPCPRLSGEVRCGCP